MKRATLALLAGFLLLLGAAGSAQTPPPVTLRIATLADDAAMAVLYAQRSGMFDKAGLNVTINVLSNGAAVAAAVISGAYDVGKASITSIFDAYVNQVPINIVATAAAYDVKRPPYSTFMVLQDSPIRGPKDITTQTISLSSIHDIGRLCMAKYVDDAGGDWKALHFVEVPLTAALAAVEQGRIGLGETAYPPLQAALESGKVRGLPACNSLPSPFPFTVWFVTKTFSTAHPDIVKTFARVVAQSAAYTRSHQDETAPMLSEFSKLPLEVIQHMPRVVNSTAVSTSGLQKLIDIAAKYGFVPRSFPAGEIVDPNVAAR
jgi:NitT/TauT family transport system substrate-binding protein